MTDAPLTGEMALWRAVVLQALQDATLGMHNPTSRKPRRPSASHRAHAHVAREWLLGGGAQLHRVCDMAGLDPEAVRATAKVAIAKADAMLLEVESRTAQPSSQNQAGRERFSHPQLVGGRNVGAAKPLKNGSSLAHNQ
ncbi:MAG: hypothetical protein WCF85_09240 [Rhodospirillaceae bacterium]